MPQGSVLGPLIGKHKGVNFHFYADDTQLYVHLSHMNASAAFDKLNRCLQDVKEWMSASKLKLNPDKTEFILFGSKKQRERLNACFPIDILGNPLHPESGRNLGVWFDSDFSFSKHIQNVCKGCFIQLSLASVLPLMLPLFGIHFLKTFVHHPLLSLLERSSNPISTQRHILLSSFFLMASLWC